MALCTPVPVSHCVPIDDYLTDVSPRAQKDVV
jgi:hypothetical protein